MAEIFKQSPMPEKGKVRKAFDKAGYLLAFVTLPLAGVIGIQALAAGETGTALLAGGSMALDATQIGDHGKRPEEQKPWGPERIADRVQKVFQNLFNGSNKSRQASTRLALSAGAA